MKNDLTFEFMDFLICHLAFSLKNIFELNWHLRFAEKANRKSQLLSNWRKMISTQNSNQQNSFQECGNFEKMCWSQNQQPWIHTAEFCGSAGTADSISSSSSTSSTSTSSFITPSSPSSSSSSSLSSSLFFLTFFLPPWSLNFSSIFIFDFIAYGVYDTIPSCMILVLIWKELIILRVVRLLIVDS